MNVAVIGASNKPHRYSYQAVVLLKENGHEVFLVHQRVKEIEGMRVYQSICDIGDDIDTVTMYVGAKTSNLLERDIIEKKPKRIIFNPGAENLDFENNAKEEGLEVIKACTLVMLKTGQF